MTQLPKIPNNDTDFTPDLARKIVSKYQQLVSFKDDTIDILTQQNLAQHERIRDLEEALGTIARKKTMDAVAAVSMRAIANTALSSQDGGTEA